MFYDTKTQVRTIRPAIVAARKYATDTTLTPYYVGIKVNGQAPGMMLYGHQANGHIVGVIV